MKIVIVIPVRYNSSRFPGKPLALINGIPMLQRTYNKCREGFDGKILVATDSNKIFDFCKLNNIEVCLTSSKCITGTDRVAEVAENLDYDWIVNLQGDEPIFNSDDIKILTSYISNFDSYKVITGYTQISNSDLFFSNQSIKVLLNDSDELIYSSRAPIPGNKTSAFVSGYRHVPIYAFRNNILKDFKSNKKSYIESIEDIELIRFLEKGIKIKMIKMSDQSIPVDNLEDITKVEKVLKNKYN